MRVRRPGATCIGPKNIVCETASRTSPSRYLCVFKALKDVSETLGNGPETIYLQDLSGGSMVLIDHSRPFFSMFQISLNSKVTMTILVYGRTEITFQ